MVEHLPHHSKVEGLSPATADGTRRENGKVHGVTNGNKPVACTINT